MLIVAILIILASLSGWDLVVNGSFLHTLATSLWDGVMRISTAPLSDWRAAVDRFLLACGVILFVSSLWSPLPASTNVGTYDALHQAVIEYQQAHGLNPDGVWGPKTNTLYVKGK